MRVHGLAQVVKRLLVHTQFVRYSVIVYHVLIIYANQSRGVVILVRVSKKLLYFFQLLTSQIDVIFLTRIIESLNVNNLC